ncbi:MAG: NUMOD3 domain-containing DNA-binding protein, partial [Nanoarchaeota archaeon]
NKKTYFHVAEILQRNNILNPSRFWLGKRFTEEHKRKLSESHKKLYQKGYINHRKGKKHTEESKKKSSEWHKIHFREYIHKFNKNNKSKLEIKFENIINQYNLPYVFVGNSKFFIENLNPDFINTNGNKIAVEVFYKKHKDIYSGGFENWKNKRIEIFSKYGWKIEFFDAPEVNEE